MNIKNLKVGDKVFIREDLKHGACYGSYMYINAMGSGIKQIKYICIDGGFSVVCGKGPLYTSEMIDWDKTSNLKLNESWENIKKAIRGNGTFKEITQSGESGKETTKAITHNGEEIIVKNNNEENDVEKAVMLLMLKKLGVTYGDIKREVEKVKVKWVPRDGEEYYTVDGNCEIKYKHYIDTHYDRNRIAVNNYFRTKEEAEEKLEKIKEVLKGE